MARFPGSVTAVEKCRLCSQERLRSVVDFGSLPLPNALESDSSFGETFPLHVVRCEDCGSIQLRHEVNPDLMFREYPWLMGSGRMTREYSRSFCREVVERLGRLPAVVVDGSSNDGTFLKPFAALSARVCGVEPARNIAEVAREMGIFTINEYLDDSVTDQILSEFGRADVVILRNFHHIPFGMNAIRALARILGEDGIGVLEFHRRDQVLRELQYDSIYHEHPLFYSLSEMRLILNRYRIRIEDITESQISGGSYTLWLRHGSSQESARVDEAIKNERQSGDHLPEVWSLFSDRVRSHSESLREVVGAAKSAGKSIAALGASSRGATLLNIAKLDCDDVFEVADNNPLKVGKRLPGSRVPIRSFNDVLSKNPEVLLLLAWNFGEEIRRLLRDTYEWTGSLIVPLPCRVKVEEIS